MATMMAPSISHLLELLGSVIQEVTTTPARTDVLREVRRLQRSLELIGAVVSDADARRVRDKSLNLWVKELKEIMYDADDIMDLCRKEFREQIWSPEEQQRSSTCCSFLIPFTRVGFQLRIARRISEINTRLQQIWRERSAFHLPQKVDQDRGAMGRRTSVIPPSVIVGVGIYEEMRRLINILVEKGSADITVSAIIGLGGIGKTTLAQMVYHEDIIKYTFDVRIWVLVSPHFSEVDLLSQILTSVGYNNDLSQGATTRQRLEQVLSEFISNRRFLLILDDMWSIDAWEYLLKNPMRNGAPGSRVVITTRDRSVAQQIGVAYLHEVRPLSEDDSWLLLCNMLFVQDDGELERLGLEGVCRQIVNKCGGIPLAIKCVGQILRGKGRSEPEWSRVFKNLTASKTDLGDLKDFMGPLYLSYLALPSHLKPCFLYCALFPENRELARRELIQMWIAEGFVGSHPTLAPEELAEDYFTAIGDSSLLQMDRDDSVRDATCRMHDLVRDLALNLAEDDSYTQDLGRLDGAMRIRRLSIGRRQVMPSPATAITGQKGLRALLVFENPVAETLLKDLVDHLQSLRVLDLRGTEIKEVPDSIGDLFHLRYLNLSATMIQQLPNSISRLWNLHFLNLNGCSHLRRLPQGLAKLLNLRSLDLRGTDVGELPFGIWGMKQMNTLLGFVVTSRASENLKQLAQLRDLNIRELATPDSLDGGGAARDEVLPPPGGLEQLTIDCGGECATWMFSPPSNFSKLTWLTLKRCTFNEGLPPLGQLPQLTNLHISACLQIGVVGTEFYGDHGSRSFPLLKRLEVEDMPSWEEWREPEQDDALPRLSVLRLNKCPKLRSLPRCLQNTSITKLVVEASDSLRSIRDVGPLEELHLKDCPNLEIISDLSSLKLLEIIKCPTLVNVCGLQAVEHLVLEDFALDRLPEWLSPDILETLHTLEARGNRDLLNSLKEDGTEWHKVARIRRLYAHSEPKLPL